MGSTELPRSVKAQPSSVTPSAWRTLAILLIFYLVSTIDKQMIALVVEPMGRTLDLDDSKVGLLLGGAFGAPYTLTVLLAGWLLDRYSKRLILLAAVLIWSLAAAWTGVASSFYQLIAARALVGVGEGFLPPASLALIAAVFPRQRVAMATSVFFAGANIGMVVALALGGQVIQWLTVLGGVSLPVLGHLPAWRGAFLLTALPGFPIAFLALAIDASASRPAVGSRPGQAMEPQERYAAFFRRRFGLIVRHSLAFGLIASGCLAAMLWSPAYLERSFGWNSARVGMVLALGSGLGALVSVLWGALSDRLLKAGRRDAPYLLYPAILATCIPLAIVTYNVAGSKVFPIAYLSMSLLLFACGGITSALQVSTPPQFRARVLGLQTLAAGVLGQVLVPALVPGLAQYVFTDRMAIGRSISLVIAITLASAIVLLLSSRAALRAAVAQIEEEDSASEPLPIKAG